MEIMAIKTGIYLHGAVAPAAVMGIFMPFLYVRM